MNGVDDLPEGVREALVQTPYDLDERARRLEAICAEAVQAGNDAIAAWAAIERARVAYDAGMYELVTAWCDRTLVLNAPAEVLGAAVVLRASTPGAPVLDRLAIEHAAELLTASGMWEDAMTAHGHLAHDADVRDDLAAARREYARAIGCAEAGCARRFGPGYLLALARLETRLGDPRRAVGHLDQALARLEHVKLLFARHVEAGCHDALGDAWAALGQSVHAVDAWHEAAARYERAQQARAAQAVHNKVAALRANGGVTHSR